MQVSAILLLLISLFDLSPIYSRCCYKLYNITYVDRILCFMSIDNEVDLSWYPHLTGDTRYCLYTNSYLVLLTALRIHSISTFARTNGHLYFSYLYYPSHRLDHFQAFSRPEGREMEDDIVVPLLWPTVLSSISFVLIKTGLCLANGFCGYCKLIQSLAPI